MEQYDVIIVGGGPAGLNAAVVLGRCRRNVLLFDTGEQRNRHSHGIHNYLTRDDMLPGNFLEAAHKEIRKYGVKMVMKEIVFAERKEANSFIVRDKNGKSYHSKKLLIATGLRDKIPPVDGIENFYGRSVFHCPYCDGWEARDKKIGVWGQNKNIIELAIALKTWSSDITLFSDGKKFLRQTDIDLLRRKQIEWVPQKIQSLAGSKGKLKNILLADGGAIACQALFFSNGYERQCELVKQLGCATHKNGSVVTNRLQQALPGLYVAGDASFDMHFVVVAAGEGAKAAVSINKELQREEIFS